MNIAVNIPTLETERMILRPPALDDVAPYTAIMMSDRAHLMGGPFDAEAAWLDFCAGVAGWHLRGYGTLSMTDKTSDNFLGLGFLHLEFGDPERELGWVLTANAEGHGYASEAALRLRDYAFDTLGWDSAVSYIHPQNSKSINVAERIGGTLDPNAAQPGAPGDTPCLVYRHRAPIAVERDVHV